MFVVFEGIDGGGKTTLSNLVAKRLREGGLAVEHVREGGKFASSVTQAMRELGRDARNLALSPRAELMLYLTREVQLLDEATRPALERADVVIADRFVATAEVLAVYGRHLPAADVAPLIRAATGGFTPDLYVLVDVDPRVARARRRVSKLLARDERPPSRKGLAGTALQLRLREGYLELAARDRDRWIVVDNTDADLERMAEVLVDVVRRARDRGVAHAREAVAGLASVEPARAHDLATAHAALMRWVDQRAVREPGLAAYFLDGVPGADAHARRVTLAARAPAVVATGLDYMNDDGAWELRRRLAAEVPHEVARSIRGEAASHPEAPALLRSLAGVVPRAVAESLWGREDDLAWELRDRLPLDEVMRSLGMVHDARAWALRERWLADRGGAERLDVRAATLACDALTGLGDDRAWELRKELRDAAPIAALEATLGLVDERAWRWRTRHVERAPKTVMRTLAGLTDDRAWDLRDRVASHCEEVLGSIVGLDDERAWSLREAAIDRWPASALKSLGPLGQTARARALALAALARHPADVALWRQAVRWG